LLQLQSSIESLKSKVAEKDDELEETKQLLDNFKEALDKAERTKVEASEKASSLELSLEQVKAELVQKEQSYKKLCSEIEALRKGESVSERARNKNGMVTNWKRNEVVQMDDDCLFDRITINKLFCCSNCVRLVFLLISFLWWFLGETESIAV